MEEWKEWMMAHHNRESHTRDTLLRIGGAVLACCRCTSITTSASTRLTPLNVQHYVGMRPFLANEYWYYQLRR